MVDKGGGLERWERRRLLLDCGPLKGRLSDITYTSGAGDLSARRVRVESLSHVEGSLYLEAFCFMRGEHRTFAVERIGEVVDRGTGEVLGDGFEWLSRARMLPRFVRPFARPGPKPEGTKDRPARLPPLPKQIAYTLVRNPISEVELYQQPQIPPRDPRFVHDPDSLCQLCASWGGRLPRGEWQVEAKYNGVRVMWIGEGLWTRGGSRIRCADFLLAELQRLQLRSGSPMFFDGELVTAGGFEATCKAVQRKRQEPCTLHLFDAVPLREWKADTYIAPLRERQRLLRIAFDDWMPNQIELVRPVPIWTTVQAIVLAKAAWATGDEGVVIKDRSSVYRRCRNKAWLKLGEPHRRHILGR